MVTYKIDSSLLTAQANEIRTLNGTTATMNPSQMTTALQSANAEVAEQEQKIIEITEMLQGKALGGSGEDVTAEVTAQTELIADLESAVNALPEAGSGSGSGGGVETCTVTMNHTLGQYLSGGGSITYTAYDNGTFTTNNIPFTILYANRVLENVVCGSAITIYMDFSGKYISTITGNTSQIYKIGRMTIYQVTNEAGASDTITIDAATS